MIDQPNWTFRKLPLVIDKLRCNPGLQISPDQSFNFHCQPRRIVAGIKATLWAHSFPNWSPLPVTDLDAVCADTRANIEVSIAVA